MDKVYTVCKYAPLELLAGFGLTAERLDPAPASFPCSDSCAHPNLCGYGKAVLEEVVGKGIKALLLVDCCDVCRRIYDILRQREDTEFLFLMTLPHKDGAAERMLLTRELRRLQDALAAHTGRGCNTPAVVKAWEDGCSAAELAEITEPHIRLTGAHGGELLLRAIRERAALPVLDNTCTGSRKLPQPGAVSSGTFLSDYAVALLGQARPCMRMQFRDEKDDPGVVGIVCHTVKFCDYYGFQYRHLRERPGVPLLKIETDGTPQSSGQLKTRLDAFLETIQPGEIKMNENHKKIRYAAGVDSGSASTDAVILDANGQILGSAILPTGAGAASGAERAAHYLDPDARTVIDIGGQDSKVIRLDENGNVENFVMNDKCAAGTGRFLEMMARTLEMSLEEMSERGLHWKKDVSISSMCTVFAESEVVSLVAENTATEDIIHGLDRAVADKTAALVRRLGGEPVYIMTGGVARNRGVVSALEEKLGETIRVPEEAQLCGALGAALIALGSGS